MAWISRDSPLNLEEMKNNANIVITRYRGLGYDDATIAAILANMQNESSINPGRHEVGEGTGFGLVQWTPGSKLQEHAAILGFSNYTDGDVQLVVLNAEIFNEPGLASWYTDAAYIENYYASGATPEMIGITPAQFRDNFMRWRPDTLAVLFMAAYERPSYDPTVNHVASRKEDALFWFDYIGGDLPPQPPAPSGSGKMPIWFYLKLF